jgi:endonuclease/exonuclease/phosphatase family metal-dependent hydrolase
MVSVLSLNLRFGLADDGANSWQYRKKSIAKLLGKYRTDFFCFQEANDFQTEYLSGILSEYQFIGRRSPSPSFWQNNIIFFKKTWTCLVKDHFFLSPTPEMPSRFYKSLWPRQCTLGIFRKNAHRLLCVNTHFDFKESVQVESAKLVMKRLSGHPNDVPVILTGDFNTAPPSPCYEVFTGNHRKSVRKTIYFNDAFHPPFPGTHHGFTGNTGGDHIDWILYRGRIVPKDCKVIQDTIDGVYPSDHFPLYATFEYENSVESNETVAQSNRA